MPPQATLTTLLTKIALRHIADSVIYERGKAYHDAGAVRELRVVNDRLWASVSGSSFSEYDVSFWVEHGQLDFSCTCPMGENAETCKHVVATGLAWLSDSKDKSAPGTQGKKGAKSRAGDESNTVARSKARRKPRASVSDDTAALREFLLRQDKERLSEWLLAQAAANPAFHAELQARTLIDEHHLDVAGIKQGLDRALRTSGFTSYIKVRDMVRKTQQLIDQVKRAADSEGARRFGPAAEIAEHAVRRALAAYRHLDDSSGYFNSFLHDLSAWYCHALTQAGPSWPLKGSVLFKLKLQDDWGFFSLDDFGILLSTAEAMNYRKLAQAEWNKLPAVRAEQDRQDFYAESGAWRTTSIMEEIAHYDGDDDALIAIKRRRLASPWDVLQLAETLQNAGRGDEALATAEDGFANFRDRHDSRLVEFLLASYKKRKMPDKARALAWSAFERAQSAKAYEALKRVAGMQPNWSELRGKALALLGLDAPAANKGARDAQAQLIEILLAEGDLETALRAAKQRGAFEAQWLRLAQACEKQLAAEAITIYQRWLPDIVDRKTPPAYAQAVGIAATLRRLMLAQNRKSDWHEWLAALCATHKAKRKFMERLAAQGLLPATI